jgi:hypothetical protein
MGAPDAVPDAHTHSFQCVGTSGPSRNQFTGDQSLRPCGRASTAARPAGGAAFGGPTIRDGACIGYRSMVSTRELSCKRLSRGRKPTRQHRAARPVSRRPRLSALVYRPVCCSVRLRWTIDALRRSECDLARNYRLFVPVARPLFAVNRAVLLASFRKAVLWCMMPLRGLRMVPGRRVLG